MIAIIIGVASSVKPKYLPGAINSAHAFERWASCQGYETSLITDEDADVTISSLRQKIEQILRASSKQIYRIIIYFAGHGLIREVEEGLWLLSDWRKELRAVAVEPLKRRLTMYGPRQVCIISDACRSLPADIEQMDLVTDPVLGAGPQRADMTVAIDKFIAAQDGAEAFNIPGEAPEDDRCLFSGVLVEGLWGRPGLHVQPFSKIEPEKITSRSLGAYLQVEVPARATDYQLTLTPMISPTFPEGDDYYLSSKPAAAPPAFPPWPPKGRLGPTPPSQSASSNVLDVLKPLVRSLGVSSLVSVLRRDTFFWGGEPPASSGTPQEAPSELLEQLRRTVLPDPVPSGSGIVLTDAKSSKLWLARSLTAARTDPVSWWSIHGVGSFASALIEFSDGLFAGIVVLPDFHTLVVRDSHGVTGINYREAYLGRELPAPAEEALSALESGAIRTDQATDLAVMLREYKHADPILGVISAYLYDAIGDVDSIRRMAGFYPQHSQAIPYDIALLGGLRGTRTEAGFEVEVPRVAKREPRTEAEKQRWWTYCELEPIHGVVGGYWPWMRQGWAFLDDPGDVGSPMILPGLVELRSGLMRSRFTTLERGAARELAALFDLQPVG